MYKKPPTTSSKQFNQAGNPVIIEQGEIASHWQTERRGGCSVTGFTHHLTSAIRLVHEAATQKERLALECVRTSSLFTGVPVSAEWDLARSAEQRSFSSRQVIFHEDDPIRFVDVIGSGSVKITQVGKEGSEVILRVGRAGNVLDGMGDASEKLHSTSAYVVRDCSILSWNVCDFSNFVERFPIIQRNATGIVTRRLRMLEQSFCDVATARVPQRLARALLRLVGTNKPYEQDSLGLSREELAQMIGTSPFTISRLLSEWAELQIVYVNLDSIIVENVTALMQLSEEDRPTERSQLGSHSPTFRRLIGAS
jgi:CRP/FNR family transcriptional regulator, nitrogen oxide reductase regulator